MSHWASMWHGCLSADPACSRSSGRSTLWHSFSRHHDLRIVMIKMSINCPKQVWLAHWEVLVIWDLGLSRLASVPHLVWWGRELQGRQSGLSRDWLVNKRAEIGRSCCICLIGLWSSFSSPGLLAAALWALDVSFLEHTFFFTYFALLTYSVFGAFVVVVGV